MDELWRRDAKADAFRRALCSRIETEEGDALYILLSQVQNRIWKEQKARVKNAEAEASAIEIMDFIKNF